MAKQCLAVVVNCEVKQKESTEEVCLIAITGTPRGSEGQLYRRLSKGKNTTG